MTLRATMRQEIPRVVVIVGSTASGKSALGITLAKKFGGEIISADSRQVYRGMDIGTGKVTKRERQGIRHRLLDILDPQESFSVAQYQELARKTIKDVHKRGKLPILVGGTGLYIQAVVENVTFPTVPPDLGLRKKLKRKTREELFGILKLLDPGRAKTIDPHNPRRLIRAIEIAILTRKPIIPLQREKPLFHSLRIGIAHEKRELKKLIEKRFNEWLKRGFLKEVRVLTKRGVSENRMEEFGLHYREALRYLRREITKREFVENSKKALFDYARRQMVWFKRDERIHWVKNIREAKQLVTRFLGRH